MLTASCSTYKITFGGLLTMWVSPGTFGISWYQRGYSFSIAADGTFFYSASPTPQEKEKEKPGPAFLLLLLYF